MLAYQNFALSVVPTAAPWIGKTFGLDDSAIARMFAWISISALGALVLSRMIDKFGRRRMILWCLGAAPVFALGAAAAFGIVAFTLFQIALAAVIGAAGSGCVVMLAEELPIARRAEGQSWGGIAASIGSGLCVFLTPMILARGMSWRWLLVIAAAGIAIVPAVASLLPESDRWEHVEAAGIVARTRMRDVFHPIYRRRSIAIIGCALMSAIAASAPGSFGYYHAVNDAHLSAARASAMTIVAGGLGMIGYPISAWVCERFGRVPAVVGFGLATSIAQAAYFWGPPSASVAPARWLGATFFMVSVADNAVGVGVNASATELFPTSLRGTMIGWLAMATAVGSVASNAIAASFATRAGGLAAIVGWLSLCGIIPAVVFGLAIDETRGMALEASAREDAFAARDT